MKIGLEIHIQLPTRTKLFCSCSTTGDEVNSSVCPICLGFPGARPTLNRRALEMGVAIAKFLNCTIPEKVWFSRKTYFYPDLAKNYQITQYETPMGRNGHFMLGDRKIGIWEAHIEEDPGRIKRAGRAGEEVALVDYNRSGVPLVEIVTAPDLTSPEEARAFLSDLLVELRHLVGLSPQDETTVRADGNISVGEERVEIKNINGLRNIERALKFEAKRQSKLLAAGKRIVRETRRFDEELGTTLPSREKEFEEDYGYIGEPDLGTFVIGPLASDLDLPETPLARASRLEREHGLAAVSARQMVLTSWKLADTFEVLASRFGRETATTWSLGPLASHWKELQERLGDRLEESIVPIIAEVHAGTITDSEARMRIDVLAGREAAPVASTAPTADDLGQIVARLVDSHPEVVKDYRTNPRAANFLIGQVMKETQGRYASQEVSGMIRKELEKRV